jgi:ABC-type branched-subunit amino acid transport system ATPase component
MTDAVGATGLVATGLTVRYGGLVALHEAHVAAPPGRVTGLIGPNGAGKTTLFNACSGYVRPTAGTVVLDGVDITGASPVRRARLGLGRTFQRMEVFGSMTVRENVALAVESVEIDEDDPLVLFGLRARGRVFASRLVERTDELLSMTGLAEVAERRASELSTGQARLVELARALGRRPSVLLLDEPSSGLDAADTRRFG